MILKIVYTCPSTKQEGCSCVLADVESVRFYPAEETPYDIVYEHTEDELEPLVFNSSESRDSNRRKDPFVASLHLKMKSGEDRQIFFDEDAYLCNDSGKTIEHYSGRPRDGKKIRV